jgi:hypothetical protein
VYSGGYYIILYGDSSKCRGIIIVRFILHNYFTSWLKGTSIMLHIGDMVAYYHPSLGRFENIGVFWREFFYTLWRQF